MFKAQPTVNQTLGKTPSECHSDLALGPGALGLELLCPEGLAAF